MLDTSHPPTIYLPPQYVDLALLVEGAARGTWCEFKGRPRYLDAVVDGRRVAQVGWAYPEPAADYESLRDHVSFYPGRVDGRGWARSV